ncbi:unnamed protein product [Eretmochelys imbricata]
MLLSSQPLQFLPQPTPNQPEGLENIGTEDQPYWVRPKVHLAQYPVFRQWPLPGAPEGMNRTALCHIGWFLRLEEVVEECATSISINRGDLGLAMTKAGHSNNLQIFEVCKYQRERKWIYLGCYKWNN